MARVVVVFESRYGNTKRVAESIIDGINGVGGVEVSLKELKEVDFKGIPSYDAILIGSPNHFGEPTRDIRGFIDKLSELTLEGKKFAVFDTYMGKDFEKAVKKMEKRISEKALGLKRLTSGLSIKVQGMKGPIVEGELSKCKEFGKKIAIQLKEG
ncbi:MAG: flavodoxin family protein [Candidatus Bathyarchaeales archaeon]